MILTSLLGPEGWDKMEWLEVGAPCFSNDDDDGGFCHDKLNFTLFCKDQNKNKQSVINNCYTLHSVHTV